MNNSHRRILEDIVQLLRADVAPALADSNLRAQVYGAVYMLENLRLRIDWAREPALSQLRAQDTLFEMLRELDGATDARLPTAARAREDAVDPMALRDDGDAIIATLIAEDAIPPRAMPALHACLRLQIEAEMRHTARAMFAEMSSGDAPAP